MNIRRALTVVAIFGAIIAIVLIPTSEENPANGSESPQQKYWREKAEGRRAGASKADGPEMYSLIHRQLRTKEGELHPGYKQNQVMEEFTKAKSRMARGRVSSSEFDFIERGPGNVAGRTRAILIDPDDPTEQTWFAGSASGGIWKTVDGGTSWEFISEDIPNLGTNTLAMSLANSSVIYAGTGEHFTNDIDGSGMFKSIDKGASWFQIASPSEFSDFKNVSRIAIDPADENVVIATTRNSVWASSLQGAIYKTTDGGDSWTRLRSSDTERYDQIIFDPEDFNILYVATDETGVIKSEDGGLTWIDASTGLQPEGRVEIGVSPVNSNRLWASVEGSLSGTGSDLYVSSDAGLTWDLVTNESGANEDFLGGQGWYDNYVTPHPFYDSIVYVGGVNNFRFDLISQTDESIGTIEVVDEGTEAFMDRFDFNASNDDGRLEVSQSIAFEDLPEVEVRFGQGTQFAHRFTVGLQGPNVPAEQYVYEDYVEVSFQAWDVTNDVQLMVSFRDQQEDGDWNLLERNTDGDGATHSREYVFIHTLPYEESPDPGIAEDGGHEFEELYFFWPFLVEDETFDPGNLPEATLRITKSITTISSRNTTVISDAYSEFNDRNNFANQGTRAIGIHPDHHINVLADIDEIDETFKFIIATDGGVYESATSTNPGVSEGSFTYVSGGFNTTQFYGADKAPNSDRYAGGMQDNGTWYHPEGTEGSAEALATFGIGGDGFETLWHSQDENQILGGSQFNGFSKTTNGGATWFNTSAQFDANDVGPFITRLSHHKLRPDFVFAIGQRGVWRSTDFGSTWDLSEMDTPVLWSFNNSADVEVSYANPDVIWAGGRLQGTQRLFVSTDAGLTFSPSQNYDVFNMGFVSGIGTHPTNDQTAYALFSFAGFPKVLKTEDLGETWQDISGFDGTGDRGFPDVAVNCLFVFPNDLDRIWVGSEIGIIESLDGGDSWNLLQSNLPMVNINDFKLSGDQLVIATYGRGIWSVEIEGLLVAPFVENAFTAPNGSNRLQVTYSQSFDSTEVYIDNILVATLYDNVSGAFLEEIPNTGLEGELAIRLEGFQNGNQVSSIDREAFLFGTSDPALLFETDFSGGSADFANDGFSIETPVNFDNAALHSPHPYAENTAYISYLKTPILINEENAILTYSDIALIEPGEENATFPEADFYDYVVVEGSTDGNNWVALADGYDARLHDDWLDAYNNDDDGTADLYKLHVIDLLDSFEAGEVILVRFRLFSDFRLSSYGWVIDNLNIQGESPLGSAARTPELQVYPNPVQDQATIQLINAETIGTISIINAQGQVMDRLTVNSSNQVQWDASNLNPGLYFLRYESAGALTTSKVIIR